MLKTQGILLLAIGYPYYGRMAYNLAMSIKACDRNISITLIYTEGAITHLNKNNMCSLFNNMMLIDDTDQPFGLKLRLNKLTPYDQTLYIDVDTLWVNKQSPAKLFEQLQGIPFTGITEGFHDYDQPEKSEPSKHYFFWADLEEIRRVYNSMQDPNWHKIYQWRSEFIYFEKTDETEMLFDYAKQIYETPSLNSIKKFADHIPDELAINIACAVNNIHPHKYKWRPTYWDRLNGGNMADIGDLQINYYVISCGSNANGGALKRVYDRICAASAYKLGLQHVFPLISKKEMLTNRQLM